MILTVTPEGKEYINSVRSLERRILLILERGQLALLELVRTLQRTYDEYKYMKEHIVLEAVARLMKIKAVHYTGDNS